MKINMLSSADKIKGQGVGSAYHEQVSLIMSSKSNYDVYINKLMCADITHYHTIDFKFGITKWLLSSKGTSVGYVHMLPETVENSLSLPFFLKKPFYWYMIKFYKSMDYLVTVNPYFIDVLESYGVERSKIFYIPNFVSEKLFYQKTDDQKINIRRKYGIDENKFVVLCVGQLQVRKGFFDFLKVAESLPDVQFVWAGGFSFGAITDGYKKINAVVNNPPKNIKFLGIVDRIEMNDIYNLADTMFLASFEELFPMTILEAMCCGVPILLRDIKIYENILFDFYLKESTVEGFVSIIEKLKTDKDFYEQAYSMSKKGNKFYSKKHVLSMWENFYNNTCKSKKIKKTKKVIRYDFKGR